MEDMQCPHDLFLYDESQPSCLVWKNPGKGMKASRTYAGTLNKNNNNWFVQFRGMPRPNKNVIWEMHHGYFTYEDGRVVCKDGDSSNVKISNLEFITFEELSLASNLMRERKFDEMFEYRDGDLYWKVDRYSGRFYNKKDFSVGDKVNVVRDKNGYCKISNFNEASFRMHQIVYQLHHGSIPEGMVIDHIDGNVDNNKIENLRIVDAKGNARNQSLHKRNTVGVSGVFRDNKKNSYRMTYRDLTGKERSRAFSVNKYGEEEAKKLAIEARISAIMALNEQGAGYTERHYMPVNDNSKDGE